MPTATCCGSTCDVTHLTFIAVSGTLRDVTDLTFIIVSGTFHAVTDLTFTIVAGTFHDTKMSSSGIYQQQMFVGPTSVAGATRPDHYHKS